jgi:hypothetical protein
VTKAKRQRLFFVLAVPSLLFVILNALSAVGFVAALHRRSALLYTGQPGASVIAVSALAALCLAIDCTFRIERSGNRSTIVVTRAARQVIIVGLIFALGFATYYDRELARDLSEGTAEFLAVLLLTTVVSARLLRRHIAPSS